MSSEPTVYVKKMLKHLAKSKCLDELDAHYFSEILNTCFRKALILFNSKRRYSRRISKFLNICLLS